MVCGPWRVLVCGRSAQFGAEEYGSLTLASLADTIEQVDQSGLVDAGRTK